MMTNEERLELIAKCEKRAAHCSAMVELGTRYGSCTVPRYREELMVYRAALVTLKAEPEK